MVTKELPFIFMWSKAIGRSGLKHTARHVALVVGQYASADGTGAYPGRERISNETGLSVRQVGRDLELLEECKWLVPTQRGGSPAGGERKATVYRAQIPGSHGHRCQGSESVTGDTQSPVPGTHSPTTGDSQSPQVSIEASKKSPLGAAHAGAGAKPAKTPPLELFDAIVEVSGATVPELTRSALGALHRAHAELREVGATPEQVHERAKWYRRKWPQAALTPMALAKHWSQLTPPRRAGRWDEGVIYR